MDINQTKQQQIYDILNDYIKSAQSQLDFSNNFELLIAVILSAQCTDKRVNIITKDLFKLCKTPQDYLDLQQQKLEQIIKPCGFQHSKAKNILNCCSVLVDQFNSVVPDNKNDLMKLGGVGQKTANVVLSVGFDKPAIAVDTHVFRVSKRLGLSNGNNVKQVESDLMDTFPSEVWGHLHHLLLLFGRYDCVARNPKCENCVLKNQCKYIKDKEK